jgi:PAS domain S-box-containing protein
VGRLQPGWRNPAPERPAAAPRLRRWLTAPAVLLLLLTVALGAVIALGHWRDRAATLEEGWRVAERGAAGAAEHAERTLAVARLITERIEAELQRDGPDRFRGPGWTDLAAILRRAPEVSSAWLIDGDGRLFATSRSPAAPELDLSERPYFAPLRDGAEMYLMPLTWGTIGRVWFLGVNTAVQDAGGRFAGIVQASIHADEFGRAYATLDLGPAARVGLFRASDAAPLMLWPTPAPGSEQVGAATTPAEAGGLASLPGASSAGRIEAQAEDGSPQLVAWRRFGEGGTLIAAVSLPRAAVLAPFRERLGRSFAIGAVAMLLIGALTAAAVAQRRGLTSEARFRATFEQAAVGMAHVAPDGTPLLVNRRLCEMLGYPEAELLARGLAALTHPEDLPAEQDSTRRLLDGETGSIASRRRLIRADGGILWAATAQSLLRERPGGRVIAIVHVVQDVTERVAAEAALAASETRARRLLESISDAFFSIGPDWRFTYLNRESERLLGRGAPELVGRPIGEALPGFAASGLETVCRRVAAERLPEALTAWYPDHGRWYELRAFPAAEGGISVFLRDVTEAKEAEAALRESEARLRRVQRIGRVGGFEIDLVTGANRRSAEYMGLQGRVAQESWEHHQDWLQRLHPEDRDRAERRFLDAIADDAPDTEYAQEYRIVTPAGEVRWIAARGEIERDAQGRAQRMLGAHVDVTELKTAEAALAESEARFRTLVESSGPIVFRADPDGRILAAPGWVQLTGQGEDELRHAGWLARIHPEERDAVAAAWGAALAAGAPVRHRYRVLARTGDWRWVEAYGVPVRDATGGITEWIGTVIDIHDRVVAEAALAESEARFRLATDAFQGAIYDHDVVADRTVRSGAFREMFGLAPEGIATSRQGWLDRLHPDNLAAFTAASAAVYQGGADRYEVEYRARHRDGRWIHCWQRAIALRDDDGRLRRVVGSVVDISARKAAEEALAAREALLSAIGASSPDLIFAKDATGRLLYANPATLAVFGRPSEDALGRRDAELFEDPDQAARVAENDRLVMARGEPATVEETIADASAGGGPRIYRSTKAPMRGADGRVTGIVGVARDVTEEREAALALEAAKQRLEVVLDGAGLGSWRLDLPTNRAEFDDRWAAMLGRLPDEVAGDAAVWEALVHPDDRERRAAALAAHLEGRAPVYEAEFRLRHQDGRWVWVLSRGRVVERDAEGRPLVLTGTHLDITARRDAEQARASSEERLALASGAARIGIWDLDTERGSSVVNAQYLALYGLPPGEGRFSTAEWLARLHPEDRDRAHAKARAAIESNGEYEDELRILRADTGEERWIATRGRVIQAAGRGRRMIGVNYDVTDRRREAERQLLLAREVDHRAKNVLAVVRSIVKLTRAEDPRRFAEAVEGRVAALARAHTLLARDRWTGAGVAEVIREELAAYGGADRLVLDGAELRLKPDAVQPLSMVLHELATNAAKYGALSVPGGGLLLSWRLEPGKDGARLRLRWEERDGPPVLAPPQRRGFGSTVVAATARGQLGGEASFLWKPEGLVCDIVLPTDRVLAAPSPPAEEAWARQADSAAAVDPAAVSLRGRRVLLVEDEPLVALEMTAALEELGCEVVGPAATLEEALRLAGAEAARLDVAVLDVNLGGRASLPVADLLAGPGVPVVHVTGYGTLPAARAGDAGALLLSKPLRDGQLPLALRRAIAGRMGRPGLEAAAS